MGLMPTLASQSCIAFRDELGTIVGADVFRGAVAQEERV